jgi:transcriptional regulator with XRE-family HTH domain
MSKLTKKLEEYRLEHRITQQELAEMLGVTFAAVSRWLNGHAEPNKIHAYHIKKLISGKGRKK